MNKNAAFFSSMFIATLSFLSSIYVYFVYDLKAAMITIISGIFWVLIGFGFKKSKS